MITFTPFAKLLHSLIEKIISSEDLHARWINTLSFLENCGARKIAACEHPNLVKKEMLKHAAEEFRHAHYLKSQIKRISQKPFENYSLNTILGGLTTRRYLDYLDIKTSCYLKSLGLNAKEIKEASYLLVTYAIELRAGELYAIYDKILKEKGSKITVKSIILEEGEHLNEMTEALKSYPFGDIYKEKVLAIEEKVCAKWLNGVYNDLLSY